MMSTIQISRGVAGVACVGYSLMGCSSDGRAPRSERDGRGFKSLLPSSWPVVQQVRTSAFEAAYRGSNPCGPVESTMGSANLEWEGLIVCFGTAPSQPEKLLTCGGM
jgi:hypothetical protein